MNANLFTSLFLLCLITTFSLQLGLAVRQWIHVKRHRGAVPEAFSNTISLESHQHAADYTIAKIRLGMLATCFEVFILLMFTLGGGIHILQHFASTWFPSTIAGGLFLVGSFAFLNSILSLPLSIYSTFVIETRFGFNNTTVQLFVMDRIKGILLGLLLGLPLLAAVLWLMDVMGAAWWYWVWGVWVGFSLSMLWIFPRFIAPLFNRFEPLTDETLKNDIESLLTRCGFRSKGLFVMDGSKRSGHGNAYFTGLGQSKRIVFFDTLLKHLAPKEILSVLAHELGHFKYHHVLKRLCWTFSMAFIALWILAFLKESAWFYQGLGVTMPGTAVALLLFFIVLPVFTFIFSPLHSWMSRRQEYEADAYAAEQVSSTDLISALVKLYRDNASTLTPDPLYSLFYDSHPPASLRVASLQEKR